VIKDCDANVVSTDNADRYAWGTHGEGWHLVRSDGLSVIQERVRPGGAEVMHYHERAEQFFYVLAGIATIDLDDRSVQVPVGNGLHIPAGQPHQLRNAHGDDLEFLVCSVPPSHGDRITRGSG